MTKIIANLTRTQLLDAAVEQREGFAMPMGYLLPRLASEPAAARKISLLCATKTLKLALIGAQ